MSFSLFCANETKKFGLLHESIPSEGKSQQENSTFNGLGYRQQRIKNSLAREKGGRE
jgi:hypothetical protein